MLASLMINNVVLIDRLAVQFAGGLSALTGETGAGKSILLDSLGLALGARSESGLVRKGAGQAAVSAEFDVPLDHPVFTLLEEQGIERESPVILRRSVQEDGRSRAFINDHAVSVGLLKQAGELLVEIHGQFDTQTLLNPRVHRGMLDEYAGLSGALDNLQSSWNAWANARNLLEERRSAVERARAEEEYTRAALEQLDELDPKHGEEQSLAALRSRLMKREQIIEGLSTAETGLDEAQSILNGVWRAIEKTGEAGRDILSALDRAASELQEAGTQISALSSDMNESDYSLSEIDDRLFALKAQARKHACTVDELPAKRAELYEILRAIDTQGDSISALQKQLDAAKKEYMAKAMDISERRTKAAQKLDKLVAKELIPLKLEKARFETHVETLPENEWGQYGMDNVQFLVATNPGAKAGALNKIASGGELARFMLALKVILAEVGGADVLVFDEVDSGIGGATADAVGERLARLANGRQILVVTHSPQVAARAAHHWIVAKTGRTNPTTSVTGLTAPSERREEIARMLAGAEVTDEARAAASKLLEKQAA